jgi:hypothetical protein
MIPGQAPADVRFAPNSGHKWVLRRMSAFDPKRTFVVLDVFRLSHERLLRWYELAPAHCILGTYSPTLAMKSDTSG